MRRSSFGFSILAALILMSGCAFQPREGLMGASESTSTVSDPGLPGDHSGNHTGGEPTPIGTPVSGATPVPVPPVEEPPADEPPSTEGVLYRATFDRWAVGSNYEVNKARSDFGNVGSVANANLGVIVSGASAYSGNALRTAFPAGKIGGGTSLQFEARLPRSYEEIYYSFRIRFDPNFNFVKGGKLTGICGGACNTGGEIPSGYDGWSARLMWTKNFGLERLVDQYVYHVGQPTKYGDDFYYQINGQKSQFTAGRWYTLEWRVKMNTPGQSDGIMQSWIDGKPAVDKRIKYRMNNSFSIDKFIFSTFFGGGDSSWAPPSTQYIYWDDITISTKPITH